MKKPMRNMIIALTIVFGGIILFHVIKAFFIKRFFAHYEPPAVTVSAVEAKTSTFTPQLTAVGNFVAINGVDVNSEAAGKVVAVHFTPGQYIQKGAPLIDLDDSIEQGTLHHQQADKILRDINFKRQTDLNKRGAASLSTLDEARANLAQADAEVEKIEATIRQKHITAPFAGKLGIKQVNLGQYISPGQTSIVTLQSLDPLYLNFFVPEESYQLLSVDMPISFEVDGFSHVVFEGRISAINSKIDPRTHNVLVQATLPNCPLAALKDPKHYPGVKVRPMPNDPSRNIITCDTPSNAAKQVADFIFVPGMFASLVIDKPAKPNMVMLPATAISYSLYGNSVFIIDRKKGPSGKEADYVKRVFVKTGDQSGNQVVVLEGVKPGQRVVSSGELKLQDDTLVTIDNRLKLNDNVVPDALNP